MRTPSLLHVDAAVDVDLLSGDVVTIGRQEKNGLGDFLGPATVRRGLELSRNLMTVRMAQQIGMKRVVDVAKEFGVTDNMGAYLPMAIGSGALVLLFYILTIVKLGPGVLRRPL